MNRVRQIRGIAVALAMVCVTSSAYGDSTTTQCHAYGKVTVTRVTCGNGSYLSNKLRWTFEDTLPPKTVNLKKQQTVIFGSGQDIFVITVWCAPGFMCPLKNNGGTAVVGHIKVIEQPPGTGAGMNPGGVGQIIVKATENGLPGDPPATPAWDGPPPPNAPFPESPSSGTDIPSADGNPGSPNVNGGSDAPGFIVPPGVNWNGNVCIGLKTAVYTNTAGGGKAIIAFVWGSTDGTSLEHQGWGFDLAFNSATGAYDSDDVEPEITTYLDPLGKFAAWLAAFNNAHGQAPIPGFGGAGGGAGSSESLSEEGTSWTVYSWETKDGREVSLAIGGDPSRKPLKKLSKELTGRRLKSNN